MIPTPQDVRKARLYLDISQREAGLLLGVSRVAWARYEAGDRHLTAAEWEYWLHKAGLQRIPFKKPPAR